MNDEAPAFVDTNILVYAFDSTEPARHGVAAQLLSRLMDEDRLRLSTQRGAPAACSRWQSATRPRR